MQDPGTGTYNGPLAVRNGFRTTAAHPVWRPAGGDLLGPHRAFRWERPTVPFGHAHLDLPGTTLLAVWHDGFDAARVLRLVIVEDAGVTVFDRLPSGARDWVMTVPEGDEAQQLTGVDGDRTTGGEDPFTGWMSATYGDWRPSPWRQVHGDEGWRSWGAGIPRSVEDVEITARDDEDRVVVEVQLDGSAHCLEVPRA